MEIMMRRQNQIDPGHPEQADAAAGQNHGDQRIARPSNGAGKNLDADKGNIPRRQIAHDIHAAFQHGGVGAEQPNQRRSEDIEQQTDGDGGAGGHGHGDPDALAHPLILLSAEVLPHKGGDGHSKSAQHHPEKAVHLALSRPGRHRVSAKGIDAGLNQDVGNRIHIRLNAGGQADFDNIFQNVGGEAQLFQPQLIEGIPPAQGQQHQNGADRLGSDGGNGHAYYAPPQSSHKNQVQSDIDQTSGDQVIQGPLGIAHSPQDARAHIIEKAGDCAQEINAQIGDGVAQNILRRIHGLQSRRGKNEANRHDARSRRQRQSHRGMGGFAHFFKLTAAKILSNHHRGAGGHAHKQTHQKIDEHAGGSAHGGQSLFAHEIAHNHSVRRIVELLKKRSQQNREKERQQLLPDHAFCNAAAVAPFSECSRHRLLPPQSLVWRFSFGNRRRCCFCIAGS